MITWAEILEIKVKRYIDQINAKEEAEKIRKRKNRILKVIIWIVLILFIFYFFNNKKSNNSPKIKIGQELKYTKSAGDIELFQLGTKHLSKYEQKQTGYTKETEQEFIRTNIVSEKYFVNNSNIIGTIKDTINLNGKKWVKVALNKDIYKKPINFDLITDKFDVTFKKVNKMDEIYNLSDEYYLQISQVEQLLNTNNSN